MAHRQEEEQAARKKAGQGAVHKVTPEDLQGRQPRVDEMPSHTPHERPDNEVAEERNLPSPPEYTPQGRTDSDSEPPGTTPENPDRSGGTGQGRTDQGGEGRQPK